MNTGYSYGGCGCNSFQPTFGFNPFGCGGCNSGCCQSFPSSSCGCQSSFGFGGGSTWFAIVLVVFLLLIICGCTKIC